MVEFAIAAASFTLIADECLYVTASEPRRKAFRMHTPWPRIYGKSRRDPSRGSIFDIKRRPPKPIRVGLKDRQLFLSPYALQVVFEKPKAGFEEGGEHRFDLPRKQYLEDVEPSHPQYMAWLNTGVR
jgi:hypothetical protein